MIVFLAGPSARAYNPTPFQNNAGPGNEPDQERAQRPACRYQPPHHALPTPFSSVTQIAASGRLIQRAKTGSALMKHRLRLGSCFLACLVLLAPLVFFLELFDATGGVDVLHLSGVIRMRCGADVDANQGIFLTVFPLDCLFGSQRCSREKFVTGGCIEKNNFMIVRMNSTLHGRHTCSFKNSGAFCPFRSR
jgi:hypothetical protein